MAAEMDDQGWAWIVDFIRGVEEATVTREHVYRPLGFFVFDR